MGKVSLPREEEYRSIDARKNTPGPGEFDLIDQALPGWSPALDFLGDAGVLPHKQVEDGERQLKTATVQPAPTRASTISGQQRCDAAWHGEGVQLEQDTVAAMLEWRRRWASMATVAKIEREKALRKKTVRR